MFCLEEGRTMMYMRQMVGVPVPQVYALFDNPVTKKNYIIMEHVPGTTLEALWPFVGEAQKAIICDRIRNCIEDMRKIPSPGGFCSLDKMPLRHNFFRTCTGNKCTFGGPFDTETDLNDFISKQYFDELSLPWKGLFFSRHTASILQNHPPVFTHGDLQRSNILVQLHPDFSTRIIILDWEFAGWYPNYWEYVMAVRGCGTFHDDWHHWVDQILVSFPQQWAWVRALRELRW